MGIEEIEVGEVFFAYVRFYQDEERGKERPVVAFKDPEDDSWKAFKVTGRIEKKLNHKYGYLLADWKEAGLQRPSIVKCNREDIVDIYPEDITKRLGRLTEQDLKGLFMKHLKVRDIEYRRLQQQINDLER